MCHRTLSHIDDMRVKAGVQCSDVFAIPLPIRNDPDRAFLEYLPKHFASFWYDKSYSKESTAVVKRLSGRMQKLLDLIAPHLKTPKDNTPPGAAEDKNKYKEKSENSNKGDEKEGKGTNLRMKGSYASVTTLR